MIDVNINIKMNRPIKSVGTGRNNASRCSITSNMSNDDIIIIVKTN